MQPKGKVKKRVKLHVTHFWTLEGVGYADALFHSHLSCIGLLLLRLY